MNAIMACVDYADLLAITLPWNRKHFERVVVVTTPDDAANVCPVAEASRAEVCVTDAFHRGGAPFAKWLALEEALDATGLRAGHGWLCLMDADVLWPRNLPTRVSWRDPHRRVDDAGSTVERGYLYTPYRRMMTELPVPFTVDMVPPERDWSRFQVHRNVEEWAGYSQIFHVQDPALGRPPWHETNWRHAGGADSFFQAKWLHHKKVRPPWEVLHLGPAGENWFGRSTTRLDGSRHPDAARRRQAYLDIWPARRQAKMAGRDPFEGERLP